MEEHLRKRLPVQAKSIGEDLMLIHTSPLPRKAYLERHSQLCNQRPEKAKQRKAAATCLSLDQMKNT